MEKEKGKLKRNKYLRKCGIALETPVAMDLSTDITRLFQVNLHKKKRLSEYMCDSIRRTKMRAGVAYQQSFFLPVPQHPTTEEFVEFSDKCPSVQMSRLLEKQIKKMIRARTLEESHPKMLSEIIKEAKKEYSKVLSCAGVRQKIKHCYPEVIFNLEPFKFLGKTDHYEEYLLTRARLKTKWILHYPIIRKVFKECVSKVPSQLCYLKFDKIYELNEIKDGLKDKAQSVSQFVYEFYVHILSLVDEVYVKDTGKVRRTVSLRYLSACTGILSVHISRAIAGTVLHIVKATDSHRPYMNLNVVFDKGLILTPTAEEVTDMYHNFIDKIIESGKEIYVLQRKKMTGYENKYMPLCITEESISNSKTEVTKNIQRLYEPIVNYLKSMSDDLKQIYTDINSKDFIDSISDITFEDGCKRIIYYRGYLEKVAFIPNHEYFEVGQMVLTKYREDIHDGLQQNIDLIFEKLCLQHLWEVNDLCETFKMIQTRATQKPLTTEELIETGKYMNWIKNEHLAEVTTRVEDSLSSLCKIIDLGFLTEDHMDLNRYIINWLDKISPVVEEHLVNFEQLKFDAEEKLQKVVEDVNVSIKAVYPLLVMLDDMDDINRVNSYIHSITLHMIKIKEVDEQISWINREEVCLSFPKSSYAEFDDLKSYVYPFYHLLNLCLDVQRNVSAWQDGPFENLSYDSTKSSIESFYTELTRLHKSYRKKLRQAQDENLPIRFKGTIDDPDILNWPAPLKLCGKAMQLMDGFKPSVNVTKIICNKSLRRRHWKAMSEIAGVDITPNAGTTLRKMMKIDFYANLNEYEIISAGATKEKQLIDNLKVLEAVWEDIKFTVTSHQGTDILTHLDEIEAVIDDHNIKLLNMKGSVFVKPHEKEVSALYNKVLRISKTIDIWSKFQIQWIRLVPIFLTNNLSDVIPKESQLFKKVRSVYVEYIGKILERPIVMNIVETTDILKSMDLCLTEIEIIHRGVVDYLETVMEVFPRLYFISEDELLSALTETEPLKLQAFFSKIFPGIHQLIVKESEITGTESLFREPVNFLETIDLNNNEKLEKLCSRIDKQMATSLKQYMTDCRKVFKRNNIKQILSKFPQQVIQVISQIFWTEQIQGALGLTHNIKLRIYYQKLNNAVKEKIAIVNETDETNLDRLKLSNLIIDELNLQYLVKKILESSYISENQLDWEAHAKYYFEDGLVNIQLMNTKVDYKYEYLGNCPSIILTPLTDRCYRTLVNAQQMHFSGLLQGPGDSGKSETIRTLAAIFGVLLVTFNCVKNMNASILTKFITGSSLYGSWLCLENFNILKSDVLSLFAQNILIVLSAVKSGLNQCFIGGTPLRVESDWFVAACVKVTYLNKELPDNLRVLFRTATLISPDVGQIIETMCYSLGLRNAKTLSRKVTCVYNTYQDMMLTQPHYYFGLSSLRKIFCMYEDLKYRYPEKCEEAILFNAIKATFTPTITDDDTKIFEGFLKDVFPNTELLTDSTTDLDQYIFKYLEENNLQSNLQLQRKVNEAYDLLKSQRGVILLGDTFTGKTTVLNICEYIFSKLDNKTLVRNVVNPNSMDYNDLYGKFDNLSLHWSDGVVSKIVRDYSLNGEKARKWLIFDGNIDSSWIENINETLNTCSRFYLESGGILDLRDTTVIFEIKNLGAASPSIISRCGLAYMPSSGVTWKEFVRSWINSCKSEWMEGYREPIKDVLEWIIPPCLDFIKNNCKQLCDLDDINLVRNMTHITHMTLDAAFVSIVKKEEDIKNLSTWIQATLISAGISGLGSVLDANSMCKFDEFYRALWKGQNKDNPYPNSLEKLEVIIPQEGLICDYQHIFKQRGIWKLYHDFLKNEKIVEDPYMNDFLVPTSDTLKFSMLLSMHINFEYPTLIIGPPCTGKTLLIEHILLNSVNKEKHEISHINFNCNTNSRQTQRFIMSKLNKITNGRYVPPQNKSFLLFIDNLNLVTLDQQNSSPTMELLRQHFDNGVWYDLNNFNAIFLENINIISAMNPTNVKQMKLCKRFLRHFNIFSLDKFSQDTISRIYTNILLHIWRKAGFPSDINIVISQMVTATVKIYHSILKKCKPTLTTFYYTFNLSDFTKVIKGCGNLKKETYDSNKKVYLNLWSHEVQRVFGDRLSYLESSWLLDEIAQVTKEEFNEDEEVEDKSVGAAQKLKLFFGTFTDKNLPVYERRYEEITDMQNLQNLVTESLKMYNSSHVTQLDIIVFTYALEKLIKICRILSTSPGNALLLGQIGSGRQSLTKLASYIYNQKLFLLTMSRSYTIKEWNKDVKSVLREAGGLERECVFLVTEEQLVDELFLENLDFLLRNGEIPNLYDSDEKQDILELVRLSAQGGNRNLDISSAAVFLYFNKKCKENLHLILCHSINNVLRNRIRKHPSLMNCHVMWFEDWPDECLDCLGRTWINDLKLAEDMKQKIAEATIYFHRESQVFAEQILKKFKIHVHVNSQAFIHFVKLFTQLISSKQIEIKSMRKRYEQALSKLSHAANQILDMQESLAEYQPQLEEMTQKAIEMTEQIALETIQVEKTSALVREDEKVAGEQAAVAQVLKSECEAELAQAIPILEDAISALNTLKPTDITLVKSMKNPPDAIKLVMAAVCVIKDIKPERIPDPSTGRKTIDYWGPSKRILGDMNFLQTLKDFDKDHIKAEIMVKIRKDYLPHKDFKPHVVAKASSAAEGLCKWIIAMDMYDKVAKEVAPKKEKLQKAEKEYAETMAVLNEKKEELTRIEKKLAELNKFLGEAKEKQLKLQKQVDYCNKKLSSAQKLIESLSEERSRWIEAEKNLERQYDLLPGNILIFCGSIAYLAPMNQENRKNLINTWQIYLTNNSVSSTEDYEVIKLLSSEKEIEFWLRNEIPRDNFFIVNAMIRKYSQNYSVFIDPQYQARNWIKNIERKNKIILSKFTDSDYLDQLKDAISQGRSIMIHNIKEDIPPCLIELLEKDTFCENEDTFVKLNSESVRIDGNFRLYMVCNLRSPYFTPEMYNRLTLINFEITEKGLEEKLLKTVVEIEKPELRKLKQEITLRDKRDKAALMELEEKLLNTLSGCTTDILEDEASIKILDESKNLVREVCEKQEETKLLQNKIDSFKRDYRDVAKYSANLYYCVNELKKSNYIYEFSLDWYMDQYFRAVLNSRMSKDTNQRCTNIKYFFTQKLFHCVQSSLFEKDKLVFLFLLITRILLFDDKISRHDLDLFLKGTWTVMEENIPWSDQNVLTRLEQIEGLQRFNGFLNNFRNDIAPWKDFFEQPFLGLEKFPPSWNTKLDNIQKLILIKLFRPDQLFHNIKQFVRLELGEKFIDSVCFDLSETYNDSYSLSPIIIFVFPGNNITQKLTDLAYKKQIINSFKILSLSNDNVGDVNSILENSQRQGSWVLVQNCHLVPDWMQKLEERVVNMNVENTHENFRLWLTTQPSKDIPIELLQNSVKLTAEISHGFKATLTQIYKSEPITSPEFFNGCPEKQKYFTRLLYALAVFHCLLQGKRKFGVISATTPYSFSDDDLILSMHQLQIDVNKKTFSCGYLENIIYIVGNCNYSGNIDNEWNNRLLVSLLKYCLNTAISNRDKCLFNNLESYGLPKKNDYKEYVLHISKLPKHDDPRLFGLNDYIINEATKKNSKELVESVLNILEYQRKPDLSEKVFDLLLSIDDVLEKLPSLSNIETNLIKNIAIQREIIQYRTLLDAISQSLVNLKKAFNGDAKTTIENEREAESIVNNIVPDTWLKYSYPHQMSLAYYIENLCQRTDFFKQLYTNSEQNIFWLGSFFFPKTFICQIKIDFSKEMEIPLEEVVLDYEVFDKDKQREPDGTVFDGFFIKGAKWDKDNYQLAEFEKLYDVFPPIVVKPLNAAQYSENNRYICPIYQTDHTCKEKEFLCSSNNFINTILLPTTLDTSYWTKRGVKLICQAPTENNFT